MKRLRICTTILMIILTVGLYAQGDTFTMSCGKWKLQYDKKTGYTDYFYQKATVLENVSANVNVDRSYTLKDYTDCKITEEPIEDGFGKGLCYTIVRSQAGIPSLTQRFFLYTDKDFFLTDITISHDQEMSTNALRPIATTGGSHSPILGKGDNRVLVVPFDNDKWVRYRSADLRGGINSHEVTAIYNADQRNGIVIGSIQHDTWKSGIRVESEKPGYISRVEFYTGASGENTRDVLPHGKVKGKQIRSPKVFFGYFKDWRDGLEAYAEANAVIAPPLPWTEGTPFGWNSWGKMEWNLTFDKLCQVSDFYKKHLQSNSFENNGTVYIGIDSGWNFLSEEQLIAFVKHCKANGQKAGIYLTPFSAWGYAPENEIEGAPGYKYKDAYLYAQGRTQNMVAGGLAMDPTHPAIQQRMKYNIDKFKKWGYEYLKIDFLTHGCAEADAYYDKNVTTGMQAYNIGMQYLKELTQGMYVTMAISPLFPSQYAHSRRIACDAWSGIGDSEYTVNSLTYGWWLNKVYPFNDPDAILLEPASEGENRARATSVAITGICIDADDLSDISGLEIAKEKAKKFLTNPHINQIAKIGKSFRPVNGNTENAEYALMLRTDKELYVAAYNYTGYDLTYELSLERLGLDPKKTYSCQELWFGTQTTIRKTLPCHIPQKDVRVFKITL